MTAQVGDGCFLSSKFSEWRSNRRGSLMFTFSLPYSIPAGLITLVILHLATPTNFPRHLHPTSKPVWYSMASLRRLDILGCFLLLGASGFLVATLEEAGSRYEWSSPLIIVFLLLCGVLWIGFVWWSWVVTRRHEKGERHGERKERDQGLDRTERGRKRETKRRRTEPVFPWRFARNRTFMAMLLYVPFYPLIPVGFFH